MDDDDEEVNDDVVGDEYPEELDKSTGFVSLSVLRQFFCVSTVILLPFHFPTFDNMRKPVYPTAEEHDSIFIQIALYMAEFFGLSITMRIVKQFLCATFMWYAGRKRAIVLCNFSYLFLATFGYWYLTDGELGFFLATYIQILMFCSEIIYYVYVLEIADTTFRLFFLGLYPVVLAVHLSLVDYYKASGNWQLKTMFVWSVLMAGCTSLCSVLIPESPIWSASKGDTEAAEQNFWWIRAADTEAAEQTFWWIRAGTNSAANVAELGLLLDAAQRRQEDGALKAVFSRTFAVCFTFVVFVLISKVDACDLQEVVSHDFYFPPLHTMDYSAPAKANIFYPIFYENAASDAKLYLGALVFSTICFVIPRKKMYLLVFVSELLLAAPILLKLASLERLAVIASYCKFIAFAGAKQLVFAIPTEIFPATSREFGVATVMSFAFFLKAIEWNSQSRATYYIGIRDRISNRYIFTCIVISVVGLPYLMAFMPETMGRSMYDFRELKFFTFWGINVDENVADELEEG